MHPMLNIAVKAARRAGSIINRATRNLDIVAVKEKAANDFVSEVDHAAEEAIIRMLHEAYPSHAILAEESGASGESELWAKAMSRAELTEVRASFKLPCAA